MLSQDLLAQKGCACKFIKIKTQGRKIQSKNLQSIKGEERMGPRKHKLTIGGSVGEISEGER